MAQRRMAQRRRSLLHCAFRLFAAASAAARPPVLRHTLPWPGRSELRLHYTSAAPQGLATDPTPIVFLPGFGVGTFHFTAQVEQLGAERPAFALDWLGQGESWPASAEAELGLRYDADLWRDQLEAFLETVLDGRPALLAGNSLGGFVAVQLALKRPDLVRGLVLMNATPLWSFAPPISERGAVRLFGWDATLPAPRLPLLIGSTWFQTLRNPLTISAMLGGVYADRRTVARTINRPDGNAPARSLNPAGNRATSDAPRFTGEYEGDMDLPEAISEAASKPLGRTAFTSILFSPRTETSFEAALEALSARAAPPPIALLYGQEDPWVVPIWAERAYRRASAWADVESGGRAATDVVHYALTPAGHCPHHEAPQLMNSLLLAWARAVDAGQGRAADAMPEELTALESLGRSVRAYRRRGEPLGPLEALAGALDRIVARRPAAGRVGIASDGTAPRGGLLS